MRLRSRLPRISHLQFLTLGVLVGGEQSGRVIRDAAGEFGFDRTAAAFYQLMSRLERDGLVQGWYQQVTVADQLVTERRYRITGAGSRAWNETRVFYDSVGLAVAQRRWSNA